MGKTHYSVEYLKGVLRMSNIPNDYKMAFVEPLKISDNLIDVLKDIKSAGMEDTVYTKSKVLEILEKCFE